MPQSTAALLIEQLESVRVDVEAFRQHIADKAGKPASSSTPSPAFFADTNNLPTSSACLLRLSDS
jgi:hypothetical protein